MRGVSHTVTVTISGCIRTGWLAATVLLALPANHGCITTAPPPPPPSGNDPRGLLRRLVVADEVLRRDPRQSEQHFHRGRTLEALGLAGAAAEAYRTYLKEDRSYRWSAQARRRLRALPEAIPFTEWKKSGLPALRRAALAGNQDEVERIVRRFPEEARAWGEKDCLWEWAYGVQTARTRYAAEELAIARATGAALIVVNDEWLLADAVMAIDRATPARITALAEGHSAYMGGKPWNELFENAAAAFAEGGSPMELAARNERGERLAVAVPEKYRGLAAAAQVREARELVASVGDFRGAHESFARAITSYRRMGEWHNAWQAALSETYLMEGLGDPLDRWCRLFPAAQASRYSSAISWSIRHAARAALRDEQPGIARSLLSLIDEGSATGRQELLLLRATAAWKDGDVDAARRHMRDARVLTSVSGYGGTWLADTTEAAMFRSTDRKRWEQLLASALTSAITSRYEPGPVAPADAVSMISLSLFGQSDIYADFAALLHEWGDVARAFTLSEMSRGQLLLMRRGMLDGTMVTAESVQRSLAPGSTLISFVLLEDRLITFTIDRNGIGSTRRNVGRAEIVRLIAKNDLQELSTALFGSTDFSRVRTLVVVPDEILARVPFGALLAGTTDVVVAPSATCYIRLAATAAVARKTAVIVGDPAFSQRDFPALERLPAATAEAREVAAMYRSRLLLGSDATPESLLASAGDRDVIHIAAHAETAERSAGLLMTENLSLHEVALSSIRRGSVVVLAGCRTGARMRTNAADVSSLAFAFLAAGSRSAVATLWDIDDEATRLFSRRLHQLLVAGVPVATAVRRVQLELRDRGLPVSVWGAFQVYGAG